MSTRAEFVQGRRLQAWTHGRAVRDEILREYCAEYHETVPPPPALIIGEILTDFLHAKLAYDPLDGAEFARTVWNDARPFVTINSLTGEIAGVKDAQGTQNVGAWHEAIHIVDHADHLRRGPQAAFEGFDVPETIVCYRTPSRDAPAEQREREFWAEEAGRAAAVSMPALARSAEFQEFLRLGERSGGRPINGFPLLYRAAEFIGVNITALTKQLSYEGKMAVVEEAGRRLIIVQRELVLEGS